MNSTVVVRRYGGHKILATSVLRRRRDSANSHVEFAFVSAPLCYVCYLLLNSEFGLHWDGRRTVRAFQTSSAQALPRNRLAPTAPSRLRFLPSDRQFFMGR